MLIIKEADLTVVGGGLAGVCAALAAAREGISVNLVHNRPVLGGNSSSEIRVWTRGATGGGNRFAEEMGILGEIKLENLHKNPEGNPYLWDLTLLDFVKRESNINLFLNTHVHRVNTANRQITDVSGVQLGTEKEFCFRSGLFVDATGDGTVGYLAGAEYRMGREARHEFGEKSAPEVSDNYSQGSSLLFYTKRKGRSVPFIPPEFAYSKEYVEQVLHKGGRLLHPDHQGCDYWWFEFGGKLDTIADNETIAAELRKLVFGIWDYIKNSGKFTDVDNLTLEWVGSVPGKRGSRRLIGDYILTQNDILEQKDFPDAVAYGGWHLDFHPPGGIYSKEEACQQLSVHLYTIPLRCLYSKNIKNVFLAGRDISTTYAAFSSTRIMNTCAVTGQAVGTAAALCAGWGKVPSQLNSTEIGELQQLLLKNDHYIPGLQNETADLALQAEVSISSCQAYANLEADFKVPLDRTYYMALPLERELQRLGLLLDCQKDTEVSLKIWVSDRAENYQCDSLVGSYTQPVLQGTSQWVFFDLDLAVAEPKILIELAANGEIALHCSYKQLTGVFLTDRLLSTVHYNPCFQVTPDQNMYGAKNLVNGFNRPYGRPNSWISGKIAGGKEWVVLDFKEEQLLSELRLFFNPDLGKELSNLRPEKWADSHRLAPQLTLAPELVKSYAVFIWQQEQWQLLKRVPNNYQRLNVIKFQPLRTPRIRLEFEETHGGDRIEVFEIRVY